MTTHPDRPPRFSDVLWVGFLVTAGLVAAVLVVYIGALLWLMLVRS